MASSSDSAGSGPSGLCTVIFRSRRSSALTFRAKQVSAQRTVHLDGQAHRAGCAKRQMMMLALCLGGSLGQAGVEQQLHGATEFIRVDQHVDVGGRPSGGLVPRRRGHGGRLEHADLDYRRGCALGGVENRGFSGDFGRCVGAVR